MLEPTRALQKTPDVAPDLVPLGEHALLLTFAKAISRETGLRVRSVARAIRAAQIHGVVDVVAAYTTIAVYFEDRVNVSEAMGLVAEVTSQQSSSDAEQSRLIEIPVRYDGMDIEDVAGRTGMTIAEIVARHSAPTYYVYMLGFAPGFAYLGDLDPSLVLERRSNPRTRVPGGSVAIAGSQTGVYPLATPGGWHIIGSTNTVMFDARRDPAGLLRTGDTVRFVVVSP